MPKYKVLTDLQHSDGKLYEEGSTVTMSKQQAESLLAIEAIAPLEEEIEAQEEDEDAVTR